MMRKGQDIYIHTDSQYALHTKKDNSEITEGNNFAGQAAKKAAQQPIWTLMSETLQLIPLDVLQNE